MQARRKVAARPPGSWDLALARARGAWDDLTGGPTVCVYGCEICSSDAHGRGVRYTSESAAAILSTALGLWADTVRGGVPD
jgi:hypothetical protein